MPSKLPKDIRIYKNLEEFEQNLPYTVEILKTPENDKIYVIGTAHFSLKSQDDVSTVIRNVKPDAVVLELCPLRVHILQYDEERLLKEATEMTPGKIRAVIAEHGMTAGMFYISFLNTSANITRQLGIAPGGECRRAVAEAEQIQNCKILLGDRPINVTMKRATSGLTFSEKLNLISFLRHSDTTNINISSEEVEKYKSRNVEPLNDMESNVPSLYRAFVTERDLILAHSLLLAANIMNVKNSLRPAKIVGVVGMGHMPGIMKHFGQTKTEDVKKLMLLPKRNWFGLGYNMFALTSIANRRISSRSFLHRIYRKYF